MSLTDVWRVTSNPYAATGLAIALSALLALKRRSQVLALVLVVFALASFATAAVEGSIRWAWILSLLPAAMIVDHAAFLAMVRKIHFPGEGAAKLLEEDKRGTAADDILRQAKSARDNYFGFDTLALRYGLPAFLVALVGTLGVIVLVEPPTCLKLSPETIKAARLGLAGAYVYVLLYLGQRTFRHDITSGAAMWSVATLALGPMLAAVTSLVLNSSTSVGVVAGNAQTEPGLTELVLYFVAGLSPRHVASFVEEAVRRILPGGSNVAAAPPRITPLSQVRGIAPDIEARLAEEGILDVYGLAMADPFKLMRSTNFDKRQILSWIDEALLIMTLPDSWEKLESVGVTGAVDLAWQAKSLKEDTDAESVTEIKALAETCGIPAVLLAQVLRRLREDMQVQIVCTLYQMASEGDENEVFDWRTSERRRNLSSSGVGATLLGGAAA